MSCFGQVFIGVEVQISVDADRQETLLAIQASLLVLLHAGI